MSGVGGGGGRAPWHLLVTLTLTCAVSTRCGALLAAQMTGFPPVLWPCTRVILPWHAPLLLLGSAAPAQLLICSASRS